jgi:hypothetical protein
MANIKFSTPYKRKKAVPPPATTPKSDALIARGVAVSFIAHKCKPDRISLRTFRSKVNGNIKYAITKGLLSEDFGCLNFGKLIAWAKQKKFYAHGLSDIAHPQIATIEGMLPAIFGEFRALQLPISIEDCHKALVTSDAVIAALQKQLASALAQLEAQRPMVEKYMRLKVLKPKRKD